MAPILPTIQHVCSLGTLCFSSQLCKDTGLKRESYPFDWIFSTPEIIVNILKDKFSSFLNKNLYISQGEKKCAHKLYDEKKMFNHHNPKKSAEDYDYFKRCVSRFNKLLASNVNKLFIITFINKKENDIESYKKKVIELNNCIKTRSSNCNIFAIITVPYKEKLSHKLIVHENVKILVLYTTNRARGRGMATKIENDYLRKILFSNYDFKIKPIED